MRTALKPDRLQQIKRDYQWTPLTGYKIDIDWLVAEVERLRGLAKDALEETPPARD